MAFPVSFKRYLVSINLIPVIFGKILLCCCLALLGNAVAKSQCIPLPYHENFEATDGGWTTGGTSSDWEWGAAAKSNLIPLDGKNCWTTGGLIKTSYNNNQLSWLQSPCFDFSNIVNPYLVFRFYLDTEKTHDGAALEYSIDNGVTWVTAGSLNDAVNCFNTNWFNTVNIGDVNKSPGWSGSNFWLWANHILPMLAGQSIVTFRFVFSTDASNNNYNGFAIDDFIVREADKTDASFTYLCRSTNMVNFTTVSDNGCPYYAWDFDDTASGIFNTAYERAPAHTFSKPGEYKVTLTTSGIGNQSSTITHIVNILDPVTKVINDPDCKGYKNGAVLVSINPAVADAVYTWSTTPQQINDTVINLGAGTYFVNVVAPNSCPAQGSVTVIDPDLISSSSTIQQPACNKNNGSIQFSTTGGTAPYVYTWLPHVSDSASAYNLWAATYSIVVKDTKGCSENISIAVTPGDTLVAGITSKQDPLCWGNGGNATVNVSGGEAPYTYAWSPAGGVSAYANFVTGGNYTVTATDKNGCTDTVSVNIIEPGLLVSSIIKQDASCGNNGKATANITGGVLPYSYSWVFASTTYSSQEIDHLEAMDYYLTVTDKNGCKVSDHVTIAAGNSLQINSSHQDASCFGSKDGAASLMITGGVPDYSVSWNNGSVGEVLHDIAAGTYTATIKDAGGCTSTASVTIEQAAELKVDLGQDRTICTPATIVLSPGSYSSYTWQDGSANGCTASGSINIIGDCGPIYFPQAFTPNGDNRNDRFGPSGNLAFVKNYQLKIFNRWGKLIFQTTNPFEKWDGKTEGQYINGAYVWYASYSTAMQPAGKQKGTVVLVF